MVHVEFAWLNQQQTVYLVSDFGWKREEAGKRVPELHFLSVILNTSFNVLLLLLLACNLSTSWFTPNLKLLCGELRDIIFGVLSLGSSRSLSLAFRHFE